MKENDPKLLIPDSRDGHGNYLLTIDSSLDLDPAVIEQIKLVTNIFDTCGSRGGFPAPGKSSKASTISLGNPIHIVKNKLVYSIHGENFDIYCFELLRNMMSRLKRQNIEISQLTVARSTVTEECLFKPIPEDGVDEDAYPETSSDIQFSIESASFDVGKFRRSLLELNTHITAKHIDRLAFWIKPWFCLIEDGAYSQPLGSAWEVDSIRGTVALFDEVTIEITVDRFIASECAWNCLINLLWTCWLEQSPIVNFVID